MARTIRDKEKLARMRRVRGQVEAVERALQNEKGCAEVLQLVVSARGAMNSLMAENHRGAHPHARCRSGARPQYQPG